MVWTRLGVSSDPLGGGGIPDGSEGDWTGYGQERVSGAWSGCKRASSAVKETPTSADTGFLREPTEVRGGDRGHPRRTLLVARDRIVRPRGSADRAAVREALCEDEQERRCRRGSNL